MTGTPVVSVLMGVYDGERYLAEAVQSVLSQTLTDLELIVVDDASRDGSAAVLRGFDDPRLVVLTNERNVGLTPSLNRAISASRAPYLARQDADDRSLPRRLETQLRFMNEHPEVALCGSWVNYVDEKGRRFGGGSPPAGHDELAELLPLENCLFHGTLFARRELFDELGGYREQFRYTQDYDLYLRALERHRLANVPERLYDLRYHRGSVTTAGHELQDRFQAVARKLADQRLEEGVDALDSGTSIEELLEAAALEVRGTDYWSNRVAYRGLIGDLPAYRQALFRLVRLRPADPRVYLRLALSLGGRRLVQRVERGWRRFRTR